MKKKLVISGFVFAFLIGVTAAHADNATLNPIENMKKIKENSERERARQKAYDDATKPKPEKPKPPKKTDAKPNSGS